MSDDKLRQNLYRGERAREVLDNEEFQAAFAAIKQEITEQWTNSPARDREGRESLWTMLKLLNKLELAMQSTLETGKLAKAELTHKQTLADRARSWVTGN